MMNSHFPFRQIHLDFHTSEFIQGVGADFDANQFADTLVRGNVDSVTLFAKCHHGWSYYPTQIGKPHPELERPDLLGDMIQACAERGIQTPVYITVQWDELTAHEHPEWRVMRAEHGPFQALGESGGDADMNQFSPQWHPLSLVHDALVERIIAQSIEVVERYAPPGLFMDILLQWEDVSPRSLTRMRQSGLDPSKREDRLTNDWEIILSFFKRFEQALHAVKPDLRIFHNSGHLPRGSRHWFESFTHFELESLPTGGWGYDHFPISAKYAATMDKPFLGMTGKFHTMWGEFGGYKRPIALEYECAQMVAFGARCSIGDQLHPRGTLETATYDIIAPAYERISKIEAYLKDARPVSEIALLSAESIHHTRDVDSMDAGAARMLLELQEMFDVIDVDEDFAHYKLIVLPDAITLDQNLENKLSRFVADGGKLIASGRSLLRRDEQNFGLNFPATCSGVREYVPDFVQFEPAFDQDLVEAPFVVYHQAVQVKAQEGSVVLADGFAPYFNRTWEHFCSHQHAPYRDTQDADFDPVIATDAILYFAHPIFESYQDTGQPLLKYAFRGALNRLLPHRRVGAGLPSSGRLSLMRDDRKGRYLLHLLYGQPQLRGHKVNGWRGNQPIEIIEDVVPLFNVSAFLILRTEPKQVYSAYGNNELDWRYREGRLEIEIEKLDLHELIVIEA